MHGLVKLSGETTAALLVVVVDIVDVPLNKTKYIPGTHD